jgi:hypothetical protein
MLTIISSSSKKRVINMNKSTGNLDNSYFTIIGDSHEYR